MEAKPARVGVYARISEDRDGQQTANARQRQDCEAYARIRDWEVADYFEDVDISAYSLKARRPEFERMVEALRAREIDGVVVWKLDRLTRQHRDLARVLELCHAAGAFVVSVAESLNTSDVSGQMIAEILTSVARQESANTSLRQRRKALEQREQGLPPTNGKRCFGYDQRYTTTIPEEAAVIREARDRIFAGESLRGICFDLEARGVVGTEGAAWRSQLFKRLLTSPTISALREVDGKQYPGQWEAIVSVDDLARLRAQLNRRPGAPRTSPARKYLLTGFIRCGRCEGRMFASPRGDGAGRYICRLQPGYANCGKMSVKAEPVESLVLELIVAAVGDVALAEALEARGEKDDGLLAAIQRDEESLEMLRTDFYVERLLTKEEFRSTHANLTARLEGNRARLAKRDGRGVIGQFVGEGATLRKAWEKGSLEWRRSVVGSLLDRVVIAPGKAGRVAMDPERVKPVWRY